MGVRRERGTLCKLTWFSHLRELLESGERRLYKLVHF